jgi:hypothetical protein
MIFRELNPQEVKEFEEYAQQNDPPSMSSWELYHPVCREVWIARGFAPPTEGTPCTL